MLVRRGSRQPINSCRSPAPRRCRPCPETSQTGVDTPFGSPSTADAWPTDAAGGGRPRWLAFAALASTYALVAVYRLSTAVLAGELTRAFAVTGTQLGALHAPSPRRCSCRPGSADRLGACRTVTGDSLVRAAGGLAFAAPDGDLLAVAARALVGFGGSVLSIAILRANWFRSGEFGRMSGLTIAVAGLGGNLARGADASR
jgi:hypothetical protein